MDSLSFAANWTQILSFVFPILLGFLGWAAKKWIEQVVREMTSQFEERTKSIQEGANGGWSLPDAIRLLHKLDNNMTQVQQDLAHLKGRFDNHVEEN